MKQTFILLFSLVVLASCADKKAEGNLELSGNIAGLNKGTVYIQKLEDTSFVLLDSIPISGDSKFATQLQIDSPEMLYMFLDRGTTTNIDNNLMFFAEPGKINIETTLETFYGKAKITGSKNHDLYEKFKEIKARYTARELDMTELELNSLKDNKALPEGSQAKYDKIVKGRYLAAINFAINNREYEVSPYIALSEVNNAGISYLDTIQRSMAPKVANSKYGKMLTKFVADRKKNDPVN